MLLYHVIKDNLSHICVKFVRFLTMRFNFYLSLFYLSSFSSSMDVLSKEKDLMIFIIKSYYIILSQIDYSKVDDNNHVFEEVLPRYGVRVLDGNLERDHSFEHGNA